MTRLFGFTYNWMNRFVIGLGKKWICMRVAQRETGIRNIDVVCRGERKTAGGYIWKYKEVK